jgi:hypothetical protein
MLVSSYQTARDHNAEDLFSVKEAKLSYIALSQPNKCNALLITIVAVSLLTVWQHDMTFHVAVPCPMRDINDLKMSSLLHTVSYGA